MTDLIVPMILSGGAGRRLWPISRACNPKQLINLCGDKTFLQNTLIRLSSIENVAAPIVLCNNMYKFLVFEQLRQIGREDSLIIVEPFSRGTAPALTAALLKLIEYGQLDCVCLVMPSDHHIEDIVCFSNILCKAVEYAVQEYFVMFGVVPTRPEVGYGYIEKSVEPIQQSKNGFNHSCSAGLVRRFLEKPDLETAKKYFNSESYYWNSGIFMFRLDRILTELNYFIPDTVEACRLAVDEGVNHSGFFHLGEVFLECPTDSVDCAVMEKTTNGVVIPMDVGWKDLGSWKSLHELGEKDSSGNVVVGDVRLHDVKDSYIHAENRLVTVVGVNDHVVVETIDAVLVASLSKAQDVKDIVNKLGQTDRKKGVFHKKKHHLWGSSELLFTSEVLTINFVILKSGNYFCVNEYFELGSNWVVVDGTATVVINNNPKFYLNRKECMSTELEFKYFFHNSDKNSISLKLIELRGSACFNLLNRICNTNSSEML